MKKQILDENLSHKLSMESKDIVNDNIEKLMALFPSCVTETNDRHSGGGVKRCLNFEKLKQELSSELLDDSKERYEFTWPDKRKAILNAITPTNKTLRPNREESKDFDTTQNLYIEGDNLEVLKLLQKTYLGKVKMIYIDPPYNTGNDFIYDDNFKQSKDEYNDTSSDYDDDGNRLVSNPSSNGRFHTDWLNMIYPRLKLARDLLTDDGVIFISIDDNEQANLKKVCDEIFGEGNFAATFLWTRTLTPPALAYKCRKTVEYVIAYEKSWNKRKYYGSILDGGDAPFINLSNQKKTLLFPAKTLHVKYMQNGIITSGIKDKVELLDDLLVEEGVNAHPVRFAGNFKWSQGTLDEEVYSGTYFLIKTEKCSIRFQRQNLEDKFKTPTNYMNIELNSDCDVGTNESAVKEFSELGLEGSFDHAKPITLVESILKMISYDDPDSLVIDFFSGSATTAHAVMKLNAEDGGNRKFIMVQLPEVCAETSEAYKAGYKNICEIGKERIRRAGQKIKDESPLTTQNLDVGFRVLKVDSSNMKDVFYKPNEVTGDIFDNAINNIKEDRTGEDLLFQVLLDMGISLSSKIERKKIKNKEVFYVYAEDEKFLIASFDRTLNDDVVTEIAKEKPQYFVMKDTDDDKVRINFEQIFKAYSPDTTRKVL